MNYIKNSSLSDDDVEIAIDLYSDDSNNGLICSAAVILPENYQDDTYKSIYKTEDLSNVKIKELVDYIKNVAIDYSISYTNTNLNTKFICNKDKESQITESISNSMHQCLKKIKVDFDNIIVNFKSFKIYKDSNNVIIPHQLITQDNLYRNLSAAWILSRFYYQEYDSNLVDKGTSSIIEVGIDEAGRGCLSGRVYTGAVILPDTFPDNKYSLIKDSKKLSKKKRNELRKYIEDVALDFSIGYSEPSEIDKENILQATVNAMHKAIKNLKIIPQMILVDGNYFRDYYDSNNNIIPHKLVKGGDNIYRNIAAASILAKVYHDEYVENLLCKNPEYNKYGWSTNMCYGTKQHIDAIKKHGITIHHRKSFSPCN